MSGKSGLNAFFENARASSEQATESDNLASSGQSIRNVELSKIYRNPNQHRKYFDPIEQQKLQNSITRNGFKGSILIRPLPESLRDEADATNEYELVYGESRYRAVEGLEWETIPAIIENLTDKEVHRLRLDENLVRKDLNPIEEVNGLVEVAADELGLDKKRVVSLMDAAAHAKNKKSELGSDTATNIEKLQAVLDYYQKGTVLGFRGKYHKLQKLPKDIKQAVQEKLSWSKAVEIAPIKDEKERKKVLAWAIKEDPSIKDIRAKRNQLRDRLKTHKSAVANDNSTKTAFYDCAKAIEKSDAWADPKKQKRIEKLLQEMQNLFDLEA